MPGELILIIEDNEKNRKLVRDVLRVKGYQTFESETAEEGLSLAVEKRPALILMDIQLPGIDGITALKRLRADPRTKTIPVIAITASAMHQFGQNKLSYVPLLQKVGYAPNWRTRRYAIVRGAWMGSVCTPTCTS